VSYASFPIVETVDELSSKIPIGEILGPIAGLIFIGGLFLLLRMWWRAWKNRVKWVRIFTKIVLILVGLLTLLTIICSIEGCIYNMQ